MANIDEPRNPTEMFQDRWSLYRKILEHNYMFHREIYRDVRNLIEQRYPRNLITFLELGCGDASQTAGALIHCRVSRYQGFDLSEPALELAVKNLAPITDAVRLVHADMVDGLAELAAEFDIVLSSFALHHLKPYRKKAFFGHVRRCLKADGIFVLVDVMREEHEDRATYLENYLDHAARHWPALSEDELATARLHIEENDFPEAPSTYASLARESGFSEAREFSRHAWHRAWCYFP